MITFGNQIGEKVVKQIADTINREMWSTVADRSRINRFVYRQIWYQIFNKVGSDILRRQIMDYFQKMDL